jgi:hypothetical protein
MARRHSFARAEATLRRPKPSRRLYDRMLIVCEGEKTEVNYFEAMRKELRVSSADIQIVPSSSGTEPTRIVESAEQRFRKTKAYDEVFVVFDRDEHKSYHDALAKVTVLNCKLKSDKNKAVPFKAIPSVPNFELWILLHFRDVLDFMPRKQVFSELKKTYYPAYNKNSPTVYSDTKGSLKKASLRAQSLRKRFSPYNSNEPYTDADILAGRFADFTGRLAK